jgi:hypothetical protein
VSEVTSASLNWYRYGSDVLPHAEHPGARESTKFEPDWADAIEAMVELRAFWNREKTDFPVPPMHQ